MLDQLAVFPLLPMEDTNSYAQLPTVLNPCLYYEGRLALCGHAWNLAETLSFGGLFVVYSQSDARHSCVSYSGKRVRKSIQS